MSDQATRIRELEQGLSNLRQTVEVQRRRIETLEHAPSAVAELLDVLDRARLDEPGARTSSALIMTAEAGPLWGCHPKTVDRWCREGRIHGAEKRGRKWLVPTARVLADRSTSKTQTPHRGRAAVAIPNSDKAGQDVIAKMRARTKTNRKGAR